LQYLFETSALGENLTEINAGDLRGHYVSLAIMDVWESASQEIVSDSFIDTPLALSYKSQGITERQRLVEPSMAATILIADDHDDNRELLQLLLVGAGYAVREARDGRECLAIARDEAPDLIVIDLSMPVLDGWGVFEELKADQRTQRIPCMAVTAHAELDRNEALETGFSAYVSKPFSSDHLLKTIATVLAKRQAG
jgi:CheY-like chemotaxis protein